MTTSRYNYNLENSTRNPYICVIATSFLLFLLAYEYLQAKSRFFSMQIFHAYRQNKKLRIINIQLAAKSVIM